MPETYPGMLVKCAKCGDEIRSLSVHDYRPCGCGAIAVDGGKQYLRLCGSLADILDPATGARLLPEEFPKAAEKAAEVEDSELEDSDAHSETLGDA
jgi:hypothetical protein